MSQNQKKPLEELAEKEGGFNIFQPITAVAGSGTYLILSSLIRKFAPEATSASIIVPLIVSLSLVTALNLLCYPGWNKYKEAKETIETYSKKG